MRIHNSLVREQLLGLYKGIFSDLATFSSSKEISRDLQTFENRLKNEGITFCTSTLPSLGKAIYRSFETGSLNCPSNFRRTKGTTLPAFLRGLFSKVYEPTGELKVQPCYRSLKAIVQVCFLVYKLELPYKRKLREKVIQNFVEVESELKDLFIDSTDHILDDARNIMTSIFKGFNPQNIEPRHGPGAVATGERFGEKWNFKTLYRNIHEVYPYWEYFLPSYRTAFTSGEWYRNLNILDSGCAKVHLVNKDSRGPRLISMEPLEYQFIQQGLGRSIVRWLERHQVTRGLVNFTKQSVNQKLTYCKSYATLDMKEASDRVSLKLVKELFRDLPDLLEALCATRTDSTLLPDRTKISLEKFAPMGSALCFPIESAVFFCLSEAVRKHWRIKGYTFVMGDDIVVPRKLAQYLFETFPRFGLKFNEDKCFIHGRFRESCGFDMFDDEFITPIRMRKCLPRSRKDATGLVSAVSLRNYLYQGGFYKAAEFLEGMIMRLYPSGIATGGRLDLPCLTFLTRSSRIDLSRNRGVRWNKDLQRREYRMLCYVEKTKRNDVSPIGKLFSNLLCQRQVTAPVPHAGTIKLRWMPEMA